MRSTDSQAAAKLGYYASPEEKMSQPPLSCVKLCMSIKHTPITQIQFDALNVSTDWQIIELEMATLKATPGVQRKHDVIGSYISGSITQPKNLNDNSAVIGIDVLAHETKPKTHKGEGSLNVYHYIIKHVGRTGFPFVLSGPYCKEALLAHWPEELDLSPYQRNAEFARLHGYKEQPSQCHRG